jgi:DNA-binding NarL/FixJ family response regulator
VRVVIVEDDVLLRAGVAELLRQAGIEVVGEAGDVEGLMSLVAETHPEVVLLDIRMPPSYSLEGLEAAAALRSEHGTGMGVVLLSHHVEVSHAVDLLGAGVQGVGYLLKNRILDPGELVDAVRRVGEGGTAIDPEVIHQLLRRRRDDEALAALTDRERDVLALMAEGRSNRSIAEQLRVSGKTVEAHTGHIFAKLGLAESPDEHRRVLAVLTYFRVTEDRSTPS